MKYLSQPYLPLLPAILAIYFISFMASPAHSSERVNPVISGTVFLLPDSVEFENVTLSFSGIGEVLTDDDGFYEMEVPQGWDGIVTPSVCDGGFYEFDPSSVTYIDVTSDVQDQNYLAETDTSFVISGTITDKYTGEPLANTEVVFAKESGGPPFNIEVMTNDEGEYSFEQPPCYTNIVNPGVLEGYYYLEPFTREYSALSGNIENQDYTFVNYEKPTPPNWEYTQTGDAHIIAIEKTSFPNLCGTPLELGDLIGVFYYDDNDELKCGGFGRWQDEHNVALIAQGDDDLTQIKEGFAYFEEMNWRAYSYSMDEDFVATPEYKTGGFLSSNNKFISGGLSIVTDVDAYYSNLIMIPAGWSGLSSYTMPDVQPLITKIMAPIINELIIIQTMDKMYYPAGGINNMVVWNYNKGYKIKVSEDTYLPMHGCQESNTTVNLAPTWNLLPVLSQCPVDPEELFAPVTGKLIMVKDVAGTGVYWPGMGINSLGFLLPGRAYFVAVSQNASVTYEPCDNFKNHVSENPGTFTNISPWEKPVNSGSGHSLAITSGAVSGFQAGDFIGAFDENGSCYGMAMIGDPNTNLPLTCFGDDAMTAEKDGFFEDEIMYFKAWKSNGYEIPELQPEFNSGYAHADGRFAENGISVIDAFKWSSSGVEGTGKEIRFYPNPAQDKVNFESSTGTNCLLTISTLQGRILVKQDFSKNMQVDLSGFSRGVYIVNVSGGDFSLNKKLILK